MKPIYRNILAVLLGWAAGSAVNMALVVTGSTIMPIAGVDPNNMEQLAAVIPNLEFKYFIFPFLAHALGTLVGALVSGIIAATHKMRFAYAIGALFLLGGIAVNIMITGPLWFTCADILLAYIPMAWLGGKLALKLKKNM